MLIISPHNSLYLTSPLFPMHAVLANAHVLEQAHAQWNRIHDWRHQKHNAPLLTAPHLHAALVLYDAVLAKHTFLSNHMHSGSHTSNTQVTPPKPHAPV
jgi:hypothetical protein